MGVLQRHGRTLAVRLAVVQLEGFLRTVTDRGTGHQLSGRLIVGRVGMLKLATNRMLVLGETPFPQLAVIVYYQLFSVFLNVFKGEDVKHIFFSVQR